MSVFDKMGVYWAEIADQNHTEEQIQFLKTALKADGWVLDLGCGTGRHLIPLSKEGFSMVGLDISSNLLKIAKSRWRNAQLVKADMRFLPFKPLAFSAAVSMRMSFGYLPSEQDNLRSLSELHQTLGERDFLIVDVFNREHLILKYKSKQMQLRWKFIPGLLKFPKRLSMWLLFRFFKWKQYPNFLLLQERTINIAGDWLCDLWMVYDKVNGQNRVFRHVARLYTPNQLQALLTKAGFTVRAVYGDYEGHPLRVDRSTLVLVATS